MHRWLKKQWHEHKGLLAFIILMFMFRSAIADWNDVPSGSMQPTIEIGDRILVNKLAYDVSIPFTSISLHQLSNPERGDIIVFNSNVADIRLVKRVVGIPGDRIAMHNNRLILNGKPLDYISLATDSGFDEFIEGLPNQPHTIRVGEGNGIIQSFNEVEVPENHYLAMGDNRDNSSDSRVIGFVPREEIVGRANYVVLSLDYDNYFLPRKDRFFAQL